MKLSEYLQSRRISRSEFAASIGASQAAISRYVAGRRSPRGDRMLQIVRATAGAVTANDFLPKVEAGGLGSRVPTVGSPSPNVPPGQRGGTGAQRSSARSGRGREEAPARVSGQRVEIGDRPCRHPAFGALRGLMVIPDGVDLTEPADPDWADIVEHEGSRS